MIHPLVLCIQSLPGLPVFTLRGESTLLLQGRIWLIWSIFPNWSREVNDQLPKKSCVLSMCCVSFWSVGAQRLSSPTHRLVLSVLVANRDSRYCISSFCVCSLSFF